MHVVGQDETLAEATASPNEKGFEELVQLSVPWTDSDLSSPSAPGSQARPPRLANSHRASIHGSTGAFGVLAGGAWWKAGPGRLQLARSAVSILRCGPTTDPTTSAGAPVTLDPAVSSRFRAAPRLPPPFSPPGPPARASHVGSEPRLSRRRRPRVRTHVRLRSVPGVPGATAVPCPPDAPRAGRPRCPRGRW